MTELPALVDWTRWRSRFVLFTGKGGVGKTTITAAAAVALADSRERVLVVSTDPASNLEDVFGAQLDNRPSAVPGVAGLSAMNLDPEAATDAYRSQILAPLRDRVPDAELRAVEEQLSGQCTVEVAAFDAFSVLIADPQTTSEFDHVLFDTAPTGHTLRLLSLPAAWSEYIDTNPAGASCLGPLAGLEAKRSMYHATVTALGDATRTTVVLVSRPERSALREAARASAELADLGIANQQHVVNGLLASPLSGDAIAEAFARHQRDAVAGASAELIDLPTATVPLVAADVTGIDTLRAFAAGPVGPVAAVTAAGEEPLDIPPLDAFVSGLATTGPGITMVMGKGGVGKTTIAVAIARGLASRGLPTHLSTTDPAGCPADVVRESTANLTVTHIDPEAAVAHYVDEKLRAASDLDPEQRALLEEDLLSPCTEELAVFQAFSNLLRLGRDQHVVVDTAPTGHTLLLLDRTGAYHHDVMRSATVIQGRITTPLMRLRDPTFTRVLLMTLAETTPVHEAAALQVDLRRSGIEPFGWVINATLAASGTRDPVLRQRATLEYRHLRRVKDELAARCWIVPWSTQLSE